MDLLTLLGLAFAPGTAIMLYIYLKDYHEREPIVLLIISFLYGCLSTVLTLTISWPVNEFVVTNPDNLFDQFINAFFKVALVEEFSKFLFVRFVLFNNRNFNEPFDGIVYAVMVSMGFATVENVLYVTQYGPMTGVLRMFTAVPAHAVFGIMMGYFLGDAKFMHKRKLLLSIVALMAASIVHGLYDYFLFIAEIKGVYAGVWIGSVISLIAGVVLAKKAIRIHQSSLPFMARRGAASERPDELS